MIFIEKIFKNNQNKFEENEEEDINIIGQKKLLNRIDIAESENTHLNEKIIVITNDISNIRARIQGVNDEIEIRKKEIEEMERNKQIILMNVKKNL